MGNVLASTIINRVETKIVDTSNVHWSADELLEDLNAAQREIVLLKPEANIINEDMLLAAGTRQRIPNGTSTYQNHSGQTLAEGITFVDAYFNLGTDGVTVGPPIRLVDRMTIDISNPDWRSDSADAEVKHVMYDSNNPFIFWVYPTQPSTNRGYIQFAYSAVPTAIASVSNTITIDSIYETALYYNVLYRAFSKDADVPETLARAQAAYQLFLGALGINPQIAK